MKRLAALLLALTALLGLAAGAARAQDFPKLTGRVVDAANIIPPEQEAQISARLSGLEVQSGRQLVVATLPDLGGRDISDYGYRLGRAWGIGSKDKDDGALLIVAPNDRKVRIEVGTGLEGILTDALSSRIIRNAIVPRFKQNDYPGGIAAGVDELAKLLALPPEEARKLAQQAQAEQEQSQDGGSPWFFLVFILLFFVLPMLFGRGRRGRAYRGGIAPVILWGPSLGGGGGGSSWGGGGSSWGGGGFSGGGGNFGGGGASGDW